MLLTHQVAYEFGSNAWHVHSLSKCSEQIQIKFPILLATSQIANLLFLRTRFFTQSTSTYVVLVNGHPTCSAASTEVTTLNTCVLPIICFPKAIFNISKVPLCFSQFKAKSKQQMTQHTLSASSSSNSTLRSVQKLFDSTIYSIRQNNFVAGT